MGFGSHKKALVKQSPHSSLRKHIIKKGITMSNITTFIIAIVSVPYLWFTLLLTYPKATAEEQPIAYVEVVEEEIEIEYVNPDVWSQWVFDTDTEVEYISLREQ